MTSGRIVWGNSLVRLEGVLQMKKLTMWFVVFFVLTMAPAWGQVFYPSNVVVSGNTEGTIYVLVSSDQFMVQGDLADNEYLRSIYFTPGEGWEGWSVIFSQGVGQVVVEDGSFSVPGGLFKYRIIFPESGAGAFDGNDQVLIGILSMPIILGDWGSVGITEVNPDGDLIPQNGVYWVGEIFGSNGEYRGWIGHVVPEPIHYGGLFALVLVGFVAFRRWRRS